MGRTGTVARIVAMLAVVVLLVLLVVGPAIRFVLNPLRRAGLPIVIRQQVRTSCRGLKGVGMVMGETEPEYLVGVKASWWHNWDTQPLAPAGIPGFVPTVWGSDQIGMELGTAAGPLLTFNEPNGPLWEGGSDLTPEEAAVLWRQVADEYPDHDLIAPTVRTQRHACYPGWREWLERWWAALDAAGRSRVSALSLNCYSVDTEECRAIVLDVRRWGVAHGIQAQPWLKEFFDINLVPWLEEQGMCYAWFVARVPNGIPTQSVWGRPLFDEGGMTEWGKAYLAVSE